MVVVREHIPLARVRALYLGSAVPLETAVGLESVQRPLRERYPIERGGEVNGIDAWLTIYSSGLQLQYIGDKSTVLWFPISALHVCAAVKAVETPNGFRFNSLDSEDVSGAHPPMFAAVMRRTKGVKVLECHSFIVKSNIAAMALVQSATYAFEHKEGWTDAAPPVEIIHDGTGHVQEVRDLQLLPGSNEDRTNISKDFFNRPDDKGYFYVAGDNQGLIKNYNVATNMRHPPKAATLPPPPMRMPLPPPPMHTMRPPRPRVIQVMAPPPQPPPPAPPVIIQAPPPPQPPPPPPPPIIRYMMPPPPQGNMHNGYWSDAEHYRQPPPPPPPIIVQGMPPPEHQSRRRESPPRRQTRSSSSSSEGPRRLPRRPVTPDRDYYIYRGREASPRRQHRSRRDQQSSSAVPEYATRFPPPPERSSNKVPGPPLDPEWEKHWYEYNKQRARSQPPPQNRKKRKERKGQRRPEATSDEYYSGRFDYGENFVMRPEQYDGNEGGYPTDRQFAKSIRRERERGDANGYPSAYQMNEGGYGEDQYDAALFESRDGGGGRKRSPLEDFGNSLGYYP